MCRKAAAIYRTNPGSVSAVGSVEKDVDPVPHSRAQVLGGFLWGVAVSWGKGREKAQRGTKRGEGRVGSGVDSGFQLPKLPKFRGDPVRCFPPRVTAPPEGTLLLQLLTRLYKAKPGTSLSVFPAGMFLHRWSPSPSWDTPCGTLEKKRQVTKTEKEQKPYRKHNCEIKHSTGSYCSASEL